MPAYDNIDTITAALEKFNHRVYNAGYSFRVNEIDKKDVYIQGSFDFAYYVNVHIEFRDMIYSSFNVGDNWWDAWHDNQIFLLREDEVKNILEDQKIACTSTEGSFGFLFNIKGRQSINIGVTICKMLSIRWEYPAFED